MTIPLLFVLLAFEPQQQTQMDQIQQELTQQRQQIGHLLELLDKNQNQKPAPSPICAAEIRPVGTLDQRRVPVTPTAAVPFNLFSVVTKPLESCLQAEVRVTASYLDANDGLICSGVVDNVATQTSLTESINLEIRPWNLQEFVRWKNEPPQTNSGAKRLTCINAEGLNEVRSEELARVSSVRVRATVLPRGGGMSTMEMQIIPQR
jgi:hypothetical protein